MDLAKISDRSRYSPVLEYLLLKSAPSRCTCIAARTTPAWIWGTFVCAIREVFLDSRFVAWSGRKARKRRNEFLERNFTRNSRNLERCWNARFDIVQGRRNTAKAFNNTNACSASLVPPPTSSSIPRNRKTRIRSFPRLETGPLSFSDKVTIFVSYLEGAVYYWDISIYKQATVYLHFRNCGYFPVHAHAYVYQCSVKARMFRFERPLK